jgi:hypothetical protein
MNVDVKKLLNCSSKVKKATSLLQPLKPWIGSELTHPTSNLSTRIVVLRPCLFQIIVTMVSHCLLFRS